MTIRRESLRQICSTFGVDILYVFGSQAKRAMEWIDEQMDCFPYRDSDVDVGVKGFPGKSWSVVEKVKLSIALEDLFNCERVDLVVLSEADPFLAAEIIRGERLFAHDERIADEYDLYILRRAGDLVPLERERMSLILGEPS